MATDQSTSKRALRAFGVTAVSILMIGSILILIEGTASWVLVAIDGFAGDGPTTNQYDASLGWTARANLELVDVYGEGVSVHTNSKGFRSPVDFETSMPRTNRVICSGDSFTFGSGVADGETWCDWLANLDPDLESVNMGLPGYSIGQALLRYEQQAGDLEHTVHLFALIGPDILRTTQPSHHGYGRPTLRIDDEKLVVENVPVPQLSNWISRTSRKLTASLRAVELAKRIVRRAKSLVPLGVPVSGPERVAAVAPIAKAIFTRANEGATERGAKSVVVYLPTKYDFKGPNILESMTSETMEDLDLPFINLADDLRKVPPELLDSYFIPVGQPGQTHYTRTGNKWAATALYTKLLEKGYLPRPSDASAQ